MIARNLQFQARFCNILGGEAFVMAVKNPSSGGSIMSFSQDFLKEAR